MNDTKRIDILIEALPYINVFQNNIIVLKYGGNAMVNDQLKESVMQDVLLMKSVGIKTIIVHGGGPFINDMLTGLNIHTEFKKGLRVTDDSVMTVAEMVLSGQVNKDIVKYYNKLGGNAVGISGKDGNMIKVKKKFIQEMNDNGDIEHVDIGLVGEIETIDTALLTLLINNDFVPVVSPVGVDMNGDTYNINADYVAGEIAGAIQADKFILLTDTKGVYENKDDETTLLSELTLEQVENYISNGVISDGMIPKVECCTHAIKKGVKQAHIVDGRIKHSLLLELFFDAGIGTMIMPHEGGGVL